MFLIIFGIVDLFFGFVLFALGVGLLRAGVRIYRMYGDASDLFAGVVLALPPLILSAAFLFVAVGALK